MELEWLDVPIQPGTDGSVPTAGGAISINTPRGFTIFYNASAAAHTYTINRRNGHNDAAKSLQPGKRLVVRNAEISSVTWGNGAAGLYWWFSENPESGPTPYSSSLIDTIAVGPIAGTPLQVQTNPLATKISSGYLAPTDVANGTAETVGVTGSGSVPPTGSRIYFVLSLNGTLTTLTDDLTYVAIKGHTSGNYYAVQMGPGSASGFFDMAETSETLDIVYRNADTVHHGVSGSYVAMSP